MKRIYGIMITVGYAFFGALFVHSSLEIAVIGMHFFSDTGDYPRFVPFCLGMVALAFAAIVALILLDKRLAATADRIQRLVRFRLIGTAVLFLPSWYTVAVLFGWLRRIF